MLKVLTCLAFLTLLAPSAWSRKKHEPNAKLCDLKTVFVDGNSESATVIRHELERRTWLKLENDESKADAKFSVSEQRIQSDGGGQAVTVSGQITRGKELLWSNSAGGAASFIGASAKAVSWTLLRHLNEEGSCR